MTAGKGAGHERGRAPAELPNGHAGFSLCSDLVGGDQAAANRSVLLTDRRQRVDQWCETVCVRLPPLRVTTFFFLTI